MNWIGFGRVWSLSNRGINSAYSWWDWGKLRITSVGIIRAQAKIRKEHFPNRSPGYYCNDNPLGPPASAKVKNTENLTSYEAVTTFFTGQVPVLNISLFTTKKDSIYSLGTQSIY
jgi:hypothetical protein